MRLIRVTIKDGARLKVRCHKCGDVVDSYRGSIWADLDSVTGPESTVFDFYHELCKPELGDVIPVERNG